MSKQAITLLKMCSVSKMLGECTALHLPCGTERVLRKQHLLLLDVYQVAIPSFIFADRIRILFTFGERKVLCIGTASA